MGAGCKCGVICPHMWFQDSTVVSVFSVPVFKPHAYGTPLWDPSCGSWDIKCGSWDPSCGFPHVDHL